LLLGEVVAGGKTVVLGGWDDDALLATGLWVRRTDGIALGVRS
jgi:hypothetical protein